MDGEKTAMRGKITRFKMQLCQFLTQGFSVDL